MCSICGKELKKQLVDVDGSILSQEKIDGIKRYEYAYNRTLECKGCGNLCYRKEVSNNDSGLCKKCGGSDLINRPKNIENIFLLQKYSPSKYPLIWSCPDHGVIPRLKKMQ
jgi:hypothetical protein